jgi:hypothetical protein
LIARQEKSFYGIQALLDLVSDTEPLSDSSSGSASSDQTSNDHPHGASRPAPRRPSRASALATDANRSDTDSEPVRQWGAKTKRRRDSSTDNSDSYSVKAGSNLKRRKTSEAYQQAIEIERESDERETGKKTKKQALGAQEGLQERDP